MPEARTRYAFERVSSRSVVRGCGGGGGGGRRDTCNRRHGEEKEDPAAEREEIEASGRRRKEKLGARTAAPLKRRMTVVTSRQHLFHGSNVVAA